MLKNKLWMSLIGVILITSIAATATNTSTTYADSDTVKNNDPNTETETDTESQDGEAETEDTETEDTETESEKETQEQTVSVSGSQDEVTQDSPGNGDRQPGRVGFHDDDGQTSGEGANGGGTVTDPTITGDPDTIDEGDTVSADCFGKVISHEAQEQKKILTKEHSVNIVQIRCLKFQEMKLHAKELETRTRDIHQHMEPLTYSLKKKMQKT